MKKQRVSNYVRTYRNRSGLTQPELAYLLGKRSPSLVSRHESGESEPQLGAAISYEIAFRMKLVDIYPDLYGATDYAIRRRAARLVERLSKLPYEGRTKQKVEFLGEILRAPEIVIAQQ